MINFNGTLTNNPIQIAIDNRGFAYGDALFETLKASHGKILFWEDHYFRLMASMRIMRMDIPMSFTMEFLEAEILKTLDANAQLQQTARVKLQVFRDAPGLYLPQGQGVGYSISTKALDHDFYRIQDMPYEVDLFKDYYLAPSLLSTLKSNNKLLHVVGSIYAEENGLQNALLLNTNKEVVEALNGNLFLVTGQTIKTPPLASGCLKGVMRKQVLDVIQQIPEYNLEEASISPFELQKADELFISNVVVGLQPISQYRKKAYGNTVATDLIRKLNAKIRLTS